MVRYAGQKDLDAILKEIEGHITTGKNAVNALDTDEDGRIVGLDDCTDAFDNIASSLEDLRGRLHGIADAVGNLETELSDA